MAQHTTYWFSTCPTRHTISSGLLKNADVLIIGGGIAGISVLYQLVSNGVNAYLVEESTVGFHASGRSSGQLMLRGGNLFSSYTEGIGSTYLNFVGDNNRWMLYALRNSNFDNDLRESGGLRFAIDDDELDDLKAESDFIFKYRHMNCPMLSKSEVENILPGSNFVGALYVPQEATFNPYKVVNGLREQIESKGQRVLTNCQVSNVVRNSDGTLNVSIRHKGTIRSKKVVYCSGAYTSELLPEFSNIITSYRGQMVATEMLPESIMQSLPQMSMSTNNSSEYWRVHGGRLLIGGMRHSVRGHQMNITDDGEVSHTVFERLRQFVDERLPMLRDTKFTHTWSGIMTATRDGMPIIGSLPDNPNEIVFCGFNGYGYSHVAAGSLLVRDIAMKGHSVHACSHLFSPERSFNV